MFKPMKVLIALAAVTVGGLLILNPALRAKFSQRYNEAVGWDDAARRADPVGFVTYAERKLRQDLEAMHKTRRELAAEVAHVSDSIRDQEALGSHAQRLAEDFRGQFQLASSGGRFPVEVRGAAYTEAQVRSQVSLLLAEAESYASSLAELQTVRDQAEEQIESLAVRIEATESQLVALAAKRELLRARQLTDEGERLLAQVNELLTGNAQLLDGNPVRTVRELVAAESNQTGKPRIGANDDRVLQFLNGQITFKPGASDVELVEVSARGTADGNLESASRHAPIQVQTDVPTIAEKTETTTKE